jgi:hypothetical protein
LWLPLPNGGGGLYRMGTIDTHLVAMARAQMTAFGEPVIYRPRNRTPRPIQAIVDRQPVSVEGEVIVPKMTVQVLNNRTTGIYSGDIAYDGDTLELAYDIGGEVREWLIHRGDGRPQDAGMLTVVLR